MFDITSLYKRKLGAQPLVEPRFQSNRQKPMPQKTTPKIKIFQGDHRSNLIHIDPPSKIIHQFERSWIVIHQETSARKQVVHFIAHMCNAHWQTRKARLRQIHVLNFWQEVETQALHHLLVRSAREAGEDPLQGPVSFVHVTYEPLGVAAASVMKRSMTFRTNLAS